MLKNSQYVSDCRNAHFFQIFFAETTQTLNFNPSETKIRLLLLVLIYFVSLFQNQQNGLQKPTKCQNIFNTCFPQTFQHTPRFGP